MKISLLSRNLLQQELRSVDCQALADKMDCDGIILHPIERATLKDIARCLNRNDTAEDYIKLSSMTDRTITW